MNVPMPKVPPVAGLLLISGANLLDPNFSRTVILLCDHRMEGSFGLVLNQPMPLKVSDVVNGISGWDASLYRGGPVQENTLHFLHRCPDLEIGSHEVLPGVFWGGDFQELSRRLAAKRIDSKNVRFFVGYSGWGQGQLDNEIKRDSWYTRQATTELIFDLEGANHWRNVFRTMGPEYEILTNFPDDPRLN